MSHLELIGVRKAYGARTVLHDIDVSVADGEFCALLGPSGSGKTTVLNIVAGLDDLDRGEVRLGGREISSVPPERRNVGVVFQSYALFPHLSVADNVAYGLKSRRVSRAEQRRRVADMLDLVGLGEFHGRRPTQLSGGQQQRVALARALVVDPDLLLLDEPLSALDRKVRGEMQNEIARIHRETGVTTVMVTHDQEEALSLADQIVLLNDGSIQQRDAPERLYREPVSLFVADFMGGQSFRGEVLVSDGERALEVVGLRLPLQDDAYASVGEGEVDVSINADAVGLSPASDPGDAATAEVRRVRFLGATAEIVVSRGGGPELRALMLSNGARALEEGALVTVRIDASGLRVWKRESAPSRRAESRRI